MGRRCATLPDRHNLHPPQGHQTKAQRQYNSLHLVNNETREIEVIPRDSVDRPAFISSNYALHLHLRESHAQNLGIHR